MSQILNKQAILDTTVEEFKLSSIDSSDTQNGPDTTIAVNTTPVNQIVAHQMAVDQMAVDQIADQMMIDRFDAEPSIFEQQILQDSLKCDVFGVNNPQAGCDTIQWTIDPTTQDYLRIEFDPNARYISSPELINPDGTINLPLVKVAQLSKYEAYAVVIRLINDIFPQFYDTFGHDAYLKLVCSSPTIVNKLFYKFNDSQSGYYTGTVTHNYIPDGVGKFVEIVSGLEYSGTWKDGFPERHLKLSYKNVVIYDGGVTRGQLNGYGYYALYAVQKCLDHDNCNTEEIKNDPYSCSKFGCVNYSYADLNVFEHIRYQLKDINKKFFRYVGYFRNSYIAGEGEVYCIVKNTTLLDTHVVQKTLYKGGFARGLYHGYGVEHVMTSKDTTELVFKARYNNGVVVEGLLTYKNKIYYGAFRDHLAHGFGKVCRIIDGKSLLAHYGIYNRGKLTHIYMLTKQADGYTGVIAANDAEPTDNTNTLTTSALTTSALKIGRASCRERV